MSSKLVDARNLPCPRPVMMARQAMEAGEPLTVLVSLKVQAQNLVDLARSAGWRASVVEEGGHFRVELKPGAGQAAGVGKQMALIGQPAPKTPPLSEAAKGPVSLLITGQAVGTGNLELGRTLMRLFLQTLSELPVRPQRIMLMNEGVRLACRGSQVIEALKRLEEEGVEILVCGTCLDWLGLLDELEVGRVSNMYEIATALLSSQRTLVL